MSLMDGGPIFSDETILNAKLGHCPADECLPCPGCGYCVHELLGHSMAHAIWMGDQKEDEGTPQYVSPEREVDVTFVVTVTSFGKPDKVLNELALTMGSQLFTAFGQKFRVTLEDGMVVEYDHWGHDLHHQPDHPWALKIDGRVVL